MARTVNGKECVTPAEIETEYDNASNERDKLKKDLETLGTPYNKARAEAVDKETAIKFQARLAGRKSADQFNDEEKKKLEAIKGVVDAINKKHAADPKIVKVEARIKELDAILAKPEYNLESLTGTWGPEKLPSKK